MLHIWEATLQYPVIERSLHLLGILYGTDADTAGKLSIGERDARLLSFREWIFGPKLMNVSQCPGCGTRIEWETDIRDIRLQQVETASSIKVLQLEEEGYTIDFRLPNSLDMMEAIHTREISGATANILSRCILHIQHDTEVKTDTLPAHLINKLEAKMSEADPQADITMVLNCPECKNQWPSSFDILHYLWMEIDNWAKKLLREVATLAKAFGWSENEILNLSYKRRSMYLDLIHA